VTGGVVAVLALTGVAVHAQTDLRVPSGRGLTARLQGVTSRITVAAAPRVVEIQFGRREQDRFVPYASGQPIAFDLPFFVRVRYESEPPEDRKQVVLSWDAGQSRTVTVQKTSTATIFESGELLLDDPRACTGLEFCSDSGELSYAP
jgi:hypothetical protein